MHGEDEASARTTCGRRGDVHKLWVPQTALLPHRLKSVQYALGDPAAEVRGQDHGKENHTEH
jgi:hypothetical protein